MSVNEASIIDFTRNLKDASSLKSITNFNPEDYAAEFQSKGYVHIHNGVNPEFLEYALAETERHLNQHDDLKEWHFKGKKQQYLFDFAEQWDFPGGLYQAMADVYGKPIDNLMMCERHIKAYDEHAPALVPAHKDRVAAEMTVGFPLIVPEGSHIVLWPNDYLDVNPYNTTALWRTSLDQKDLPENVLKDIEPVRIYANPGDIVMFRGNSIYHERVNAANCTLLYLKFNFNRLDPLGEDIRTPGQQAKSQEILKSKSDADLLNSVVEVSPRLDKISRHYTRMHWKEVIQAYVHGEKEITLSEFELQAFKHIDGTRTVSQVLERLGVAHPEFIKHAPMFRRLGLLKGIDFLS